MTITNPVDNATVSGTVDVTATFDGTGLSNVEFVVGNFSIGTDTRASGGVYSKTWDTTGVSDGTYTIVAVAHGSGGSELDTDQVTVTIGNSTPTPVTDPQVFTSEVFPVSEWRIVQVSGTIIVVRPTLEFPGGLNGTYYCYAAYSKDGDIYLAEQDISGETIFRRFRSGDSVKNFKQKTFSGQTSWTPDVFNSLPNPDLNIIQTRGVVFLLAVAPAGGGPMEGVIFTFEE